VEDVQEMIDSMEFEKGREKKNNNKNMHTHTAIYFIYTCFLSSAILFRSGKVGSRDTSDAALP
jgi:hypothetical protein